MNINLKCHQYFKYNLEMIFAIPYQNIILSNVSIMQEFTLDKYGRKIALINYNDLYNLPIITEKMRIISFDKEKNWLQLDGRDKNCHAFIDKLQKLQDYIINYIYTHKKKYFDSDNVELKDLSITHFQNLFQVMVKDGIITLYLNQKNTTFIHNINTENQSESELDQEKLQPGKYIKIVLRIHGVLLMNIYNLLPLMRIQYSIPFCFV